MTASYRIFNVTLRRRVAVTPSLLRCVFTGPEVAHMKHEAPDQRIKLLFARSEGETARLPVSASWYQDYLALPRERRPLMRTYTLRALRRAACELDVEFVLHGDSGPASRWAMHAKPGDALQIVAPDGDFQGDSGGYEWAADDALREALLVADETALPAALGILEQLARKPAPPRVQAFLEVPLAQDIQPLRYPFADIHWLARDGDTAHGARLLSAVREPPRCRRARSPPHRMCRRKKMTTRLSGSAPTGLGTFAPGWRRSPAWSNGCVIILCANASSTRLAPALWPTGRAVRATPDPLIPHSGCILI